LDTDDGVLASMLPRRFLIGVAKAFSICLLPEDIGVRPSLVTLSASYLPARLLGVDCTCARDLPGVPGGFVVSFLDGVPSSFSTKRSNKPSTRPSLCGVGPREVTGAGLKSFLDMAGVFMSSSSRDCCFDGVSTHLFRLSGVSTGIGSG
jgi:hypothetical protein